MSEELKPCPFCGGAVKLEQPVDRTPRNEWWGIVCRNTTNVGGTCAIEQRPSRTKEAAIARWNRRAPIARTRALKKTREALEWAIAEIEERTRYERDEQFDNALAIAKSALDGNAVAAEPAS